MAVAANAVERQITTRAVGHVLTNVNAWSADSRWIVYDTRSDAAGERFDGSTIEIVHVDTGEVREVYRSRNGSHCGVATFSPKSWRVAFILGPENPTDDWRYAAWHRQGVIVDFERPQIATPLDARDITPPFTTGAFAAAATCMYSMATVSGLAIRMKTTYLRNWMPSTLAEAHGWNQRNIGVSVPRQAVTVPRNHPRNHDGSMFSVLVTRTVNSPVPGSDEISRAFEESWIGTRGYVRLDGTRQHHAIAFQGIIVTTEGKAISEVFVVDIPDDVTQPGHGPLAGTATTRPAPPLGVRQRRLTFTADRKYPGIQGPRHWLRSSPNGDRIAFLMRDDDGVVQIWTISPNGGEPQSLTHNPFDVASAFSWSPDGSSIAYVADNSVFITDSTTGRSTRLTPRSADASAPRPEACVFSPDGSRIAYVRTVQSDGAAHNQIFVVTVR